MRHRGINLAGITLAAIVLLACLVLAVPCGAGAAGEEAARERLVAEVAADGVRLLGGQGLDKRVLKALGEVPRHEFVPGDVWARAYENRPLPIGFGQTISQPFVVALMTHLARPEPGHAVLEVGTGSGFQAAVMARLVARVETLEIIPQLANAARERLARLGFGNVSVRTGDGYFGWEAGGPYDSILVTAAAGHIPPPLVSQLKPGGRMVIPVGAPFMTQELMVVDKAADGTVSTRSLLPVAFVPLSGGH